MRVPELLSAALAFNVAVALLCIVDFLRAPKPGSLRATRTLTGVLSCGIANRVSLQLEATSATRGALKGEWEDAVGPGPLTEGRRQRFELNHTLKAEWRITPLRRGDLAFGDLTVRLRGQWGLCARQFTVPLTATAKVYPDVSVLERDALALNQAQLDEARRVVKKISAGREFETLRDYAQGDDRRHLDWKATARRARPMVRVYRPEQNQGVMILLDCGRHMAGEIDGQRKVDLAVDASLRLARACVEQGDHVGFLAFATTVKAALAPQKGRAGLKAMSDLLYRVDATLEESDYALAIDRALLGNTRRTLVVLLTELVDPESAEVLWRHTRRLLPRHLPMVVSLKDTVVEKLSTAVPESAEGAFERRVAQRLEGAFKKTAANLREVGARVVRTPAAQFGAATVNAYLEIKSRGLL